MTGLASSDFARHYSRNHCCFLFLWVLRCFTSPRSLYPPYIFRRESPGQHAAWRGFPIRRPSDHSSIISSPRLIADFYVLLRLQMPRHPPFALKNLTTKCQRKNGPTQRRNHLRGISVLSRYPTGKTGREEIALEHTHSKEIMRSRCSRPLCSSQKTGDTKNPRQVMPELKVRTRSSTNDTRSLEHQPVWSLRTQQRARPHHPTPQPFHTPKGAVLSTKPSCEGHCQCSTHERHPQHSLWRDLTR